MSPKKKPAAPQWPRNPATARSSRDQVIVVAGLIALAIAVAYADSFRGRFYFDDNTSLLGNASIRHLWPPWIPLLPPHQVTTGGRPLANLTFALNYALGGYDVEGYHAVNLLIHIGAALVLFGIARRLFYSPALTRQFAGNETLAAALVASLWALHPLQTEAVTYIAQRVESLMGFFFLLTLYFFIRSAEESESENRKAESGNMISEIGSKFPHSAFRFPLLSFVACLLGAATKEVIALAPVMVFLCDRTFYAGSFAGAWRRRWRFHLCLMATWIPLAFFVASTGWNRGGSAGFDVGVRPWAYWLTQFEAVAQYLKLSLWPHPLVFDYGTFWRTPAQALPYALVVVPLGLAALAALWLKPVWGFLGFWFFAILAPTSVVPGTFQMIVEHRMYLSLAAVAAAAVGICNQLWGRKGLLYLLPLVVLLGVLTFLRNGEYQSPVAMWTVTAAARPENSRAHNNLGNAYLDEGRLEEAAAEYRAALRLAPDSMEAHGNLGNVLLSTGHVAEAIRECSLAVALKPGQSTGHLCLADALFVAGRVPEAAAEFRKAVSLAPASVPALVGLGRLLVSQGNYPEAVATLEKAVSLAPENASAQFALGNALLRSGRDAEAVGHYHAALTIDPENTDAWNNLGNALLDQGLPGDAAAAFEEAIRIRPDQAISHNNLGAALSRLGQTSAARAEFQAALRLDPNYADALRNLESLH